MRIRKIGIVTRNEQTSQLEETIEHQGYDTLLIKEESQIEYVDALLIEREEESQISQVVSYLILGKKQRTPYQRVCGRSIYN